MLIAAILPTGHGKTTIHGTIPGVYDAAELVVSKSHLKLLRKQARERHEWGDLDAWWSDQIKTNLPRDCTVIMVPSLHLAEACGVSLIVTILLPVNLLHSALAVRPKSGILNAIANRYDEEAVGHNIIYAHNHTNLANILKLLAFNRWLPGTRFLTKNEKNDTHIPPYIRNRTVTMPHTERNWRIIIPDLQKTINHERAAAQEWKRVAECRLGFLRQIDKALTLMVGQAASIERVFNVDAPQITTEDAGAAASGEEVARLCRVKMGALVSFTSHLAQEAVAAEQTLVDVYGIAQEALRTDRPTMDTASSRFLDVFDPAQWGFAEGTTMDMLTVSTVQLNTDHADADETSVVPYDAGRNTQEESRTEAMVSFLSGK